MIAVEQGRWTVPQVDGTWQAILSPEPGSDVIVQRKPAVQVPADYFSETWRLTATEWATLHETQYGLALNGSPIAEHNTRKAAWRDLKEFANGTLPYDEATVRKVVGRIRRLLLDLSDEVT